MNLQSYIADFITVVNNIIIPFILGIAFLFFIINVIRFFVIGGTTDEGKQKSKQLAVYSVAAFVFILLFWGLVNLFTSSLGLTRLGNSESNCFDYDTTCLTGNSLPAVSPTPSPHPPIFVPPTPSPHPPTAVPPTQSPHPPTSPPQSTPSPHPPTFVPPTTPVTPRPAADYSAVVSRQLQGVVADVFDDIDWTFLSDQFALISEADIPDSQRVNTAKAFAEAGLITNTDFLTVLSAVNTVRAQAGFPAISPSIAVADPQYTRSLQNYTSSVSRASDIISTWYGPGFTTSNTIEGLFNTSDYTLAERQAAAADVLAQINPGTNPSLIIELRSAIAIAHSIENRTNSN